MSTVARYIRHAERFGVADVFETALGEYRHLSPKDLGRLSLRLQNIDPKWTLSQPRRLAFARVLVRDGVDAKTICRMAMISRRTLKRAQAQKRDQDFLEAGLEPLPQVPFWTSQPAFQSGEKWTKQPPEGNASRSPGLVTFLAVPEGAA
jgi:hypothetical protein